MNGWQIGLCVFAALSVLAFIILRAACASGKREDEAAAQLSDAECRTDRCEEFPVFHSEVK